MNTADIYYSNVLTSQGNYNCYYNSDKYIIMLEPLGFQKKSEQEQFYSYLFAIAEVMVWAKNNKINMVEPFIMSQPRDNLIQERGNNDHSKVLLGKRWDTLGTFFDLSDLCKYVNIISFNKFIKISDYNIDKCCQYNIKPGNEAFGKNFKIKSFQTCKRSSIPIINNLKFMGLYRYDRSNPKSINNEFFQYINYHPDILRKAAEFINANLTLPYLSLHWRRGGRAFLSSAGQQYMKKCNPQYVVDHVRKILREKPFLKKVFLATNCEVPEHINFLRNNLPIVIRPRSSEWKYHTIDALIENIICISSTIFLQFSDSSFSQFIVRKRNILKKQNIQRVLFTGA